MADDWQSLADLAATPADNDEFLTKDTSDTTDNAVGTVKRNSYLNVLGTVLAALRSAFTPASATGPASLALAEDTDNGSNTVSIAAPAAVAANVVVTLPGAAGTLLRAEDVASGTITPRADDINFSGGSDGHVLTVQADGSLALEAVPGGGNVSKVGTPVDNQVGVWTGDGTIEGSAGLTWDGAALLINDGVLFIKEQAGSDANVTGYGQIWVSSAGATPLLMFTDDLGTEYQISGTQENIDWTIDQGATNIHAGNIPDLSGTYQPADADLTAIVASYAPASSAGPTTFAFAEDTDNGINTITLSAPSTIASNVILTLQAVSGQVYSSNGTDVAVADGGTGASDASGARTNLGLVIGTDVAPVNNPVFTGTVTIPDGALAIADTSGLQTALDAKLALAGGTVTGVILLGTAGSISDAGPISASGALTKATHGGRTVLTTGNVTIPNAAGDVGMRGQIILGGAHTITFNSTVTATLATGDVFSYYVQSTTVLKRALLPTASQPAMS